MEISSIIKKNPLLFFKFKYIKSFATLNRINFIKSDDLTFYLMIKKNSNHKKLVKFKKLIDIQLQLDYEIKILYLLIEYSINLYFASLNINAPVRIYIKFLTVYNFDYINRWFLNFILAVHINNKIYSKFCFINFINSYNYFQHKKLVFKLFVLKIKSVNNKTNI